MWISVNERLPKDDVYDVIDVLVRVKAGVNEWTDVMPFDQDDQFFLGDLNGDVTHWMYLPDPPKTADPRAETKREGVEL